MTTKLEFKTIETVLMEFGSFDEYSNLSVLWFLSN